MFSRIHYGIEIYGGCSETLLKKIQTIQNKLLKVLFNLPRRTNTNELHSRLKILKVKDIYQSQVLKFVFESLKKTNIVQFHNLFRYKHTIHTHNTRQPMKLYSTIMRTKYGKSTLYYKGTQLWNLLSTDVQNCSTLYGFKRIVKQKFIDSYS